MAQVTGKMNKDLELGENFAITNKREEELRKMKSRRGVCSELITDYGDREEELGQLEVRAVLGAAFSLDLSLVLTLLTSSCLC
jgi:hypothetical protein